VKPAEYAKAIAGAVMAGLGVLYIALSDDRVTAQEAVAVASASLAAFATVWGVPNAAKTNTVSQQTVTVTSTDTAPTVSTKTLEELAGPPMAGVQDEAPKHSADNA
jgi:hypothetical protein